MAGSADIQNPPKVEWSTIESAGGIQTWVYSELKRLELIDNVDTSTLSKAQRKAYKAKREEERRVKGLLKKAGWEAYQKAHIVHVGQGVFWHDTADVDRFDADDPIARLEQNDLPAIANAQALAKVLGLSIPRLRWLSFSREVDTGCHYHMWTVPKRDGTKRLISAPKPTLKAAQHWIAQNISEHLPIHEAAHGFVPGRSTVSNARAHAGATAIFKFDIRDFYPSITMPRVKGLFRQAGYGEQVATLMALLCTEFPREEMKLRGTLHYVATGKRSLPQGAPTSPSITNALCLGLDKRLQGLAKHLGLTYTRYADDLTFSFKGKGADAPVMRLKQGVKKIVEAEGFSIKDSKTRIRRAGRRQRVTGLVVNESTSKAKARVPRFRMRQLRVALHKLEQGKESKESIEQLRGWAAYVYMTDPERGRKLLNRIKKLPQAQTKTSEKQETSDE